MASGPNIPKIKTSAPVPVEVALGPITRFARLESAGGIVLIACAVLAMVWANSPAAASYVRLFHETKFTVGFGEWALSKAFILWINDLLMAVFFLLVGLEIKREVVVGELRSPKAAALPIAAAIGGMAFPGAIYALVNLGEPGLRGWGVPMATDIAFALGVMALLGSRVPVSLKVFLTSLAIVDDLGAALLIIAIFYTDSVGFGYLGWAAALLVALVAINLAGVRSRLPYLLIGLVVWYFFLKSGVHATIAGVLVALTIPARTRVDRAAFAEFAQSMLDRFRADGVDGGRRRTTSNQQGALLALEDANEKVETPLRSLDTLIPWVAFLILPVFALANAGVALTAGGGDEAAPVWTSRVLLGVVLGLVIGKPLGVLLCSWIAVKLGVARLPTGVSWGQVHGAGWLSGIGFTMALFIANLAFKEDAAMLDAAKLGVLGASVLAGIVGLVILARATRGGGNGRG